MQTIKNDQDLPHYKKCLHFGLQSYHRGFFGTLICLTPNLATYNEITANFMSYFYSGQDLASATYITIAGNCEEELPKKPVGRLSLNCRPTGYRQSTDSLPTANQQVTDRLRKKKNCVKNEQLT